MSDFDPLAEMYAIADDDEVDVLDDLRLRAGLIWTCPKGWRNPRDADVCECCDARRPCPQGRHRPDDDPEPGDRCKDCGRDLTWRGPDPYDFDLSD